MPAVLKFDRPAIEERINDVGAYLGISGGFNVFIDYIVKTRADLDVPDTLTNLGVPVTTFACRNYAVS